MTVAGVASKGLNRLHWFSVQMTHAEITYVLSVALQVKRPLKTAGEALYSSLRSVRLYIHHQQLSKICKRIIFVSFFFVLSVNVCMCSRITGKNTGLFLKRILRLLKCCLTYIKAYGSIREHSILALHCIILVKLFMHCVAILLVTAYNKQVIFRIFITNYRETP